MWCGGTSNMITVLQAQCCQPGSVGRNEASLSTRGGHISGVGGNNARPILLTRVMGVFQSLPCQRCPYCYHCPHRVGLLWSTPPKPPCCPLPLSAPQYDYLACTRQCSGKGTERSYWLDVRASLSNRQAKMVAINCGVYLVRNFVVIVWLPCCDLPAGEQWWLVSCCGFIENLGVMASHGSKWDRIAMLYCLMYWHGRRKIDNKTNEDTYLVPHPTEDKAYRWVCHCAGLTPVLAPDPLAGALPLCPPL